METLKLLFVSSDIMNNKVFYQHPNLMRVLGMHETVMEVMVNVLGGDKSQVNLFTLTMQCVILKLVNCCISKAETYHFCFPANCFSQDGGKLLQIPLLFL